MCGVACSACPPELRACPCPGWEPGERPLKKHHLNLNSSCSCMASHLVQPIGHTPGAEAMHQPGFPAARASYDKKSSLPVVCTGVRLWVASGPRAGPRAGRHFVRKFALTASPLHKLKILLQGTVQAETCSGRQPPCQSAKRRCRGAKVQLHLQASEQTCTRR